MRSALFLWLSAATLLAVLSTSSPVYAAPLLGLLGGAAANTGSTVAASSTNKIRGVNLGGWFILEAWMTPSLFTTAQQANKAATLPNDQWSFMKTYANQADALTALKQHWSTWIVESDFQQIKKLGLNTVRLPVPHWAYSANATEPYAALAEQPYISQALLWASKYGLGVILDMHTAPGSQNGFDSSGHIGDVNFRSATDAATNLQRLNNALTSLVTMYVNDAKYGGVVKYIEVLNEPLCSVLGADYMTGVYANSASVINTAVSKTALTKPQVLLHDCFISPLSAWKPAVSSGGGLANTAFSLDTHRYHVFAPRNNMSLQQHINLVHADGNEIAAATSSLGRTIITGEFSLALSCTDCPTGTSATVSAADIAKLNRQFFETQTTAYERGAGWIFWNWKSDNNLPWSYKDALTAQWIPTNPAEKTLAL